jgi:hypothetical protein
VFDQLVGAIHAAITRSPTPRSIAVAEAQLGDISQEQLTAVERLMTQAREADRAGDEGACAKVLSEVRHVFEY